MGISLGFLKIIPKFSWEFQGRFAPFSTPDNPGNFYSHLEFQPINEGLRVTPNSQLEFGKCHHCPIFLGDGETREIFRSGIFCLAAGPDSYPKIRKFLINSALHPGVPQPDLGAVPVFWHDPKSAGKFQRELSFCRIGERWDHGKKWEFGEVGSLSWNSRLILDLGLCLDRRFGVRFGIQPNLGSFFGIWRGWNSRSHRGQPLQTPKNIPNLVGIPGWNSRSDHGQPLQAPNLAGASGWNSNQIWDIFGDLEGLSKGVTWNSNLEFQPGIPTRNSSQIWDLFWDWSGFRGLT